MTETTFEIDKPALEVRTARNFDASPERLWQACTDPAQIPRWWGPAVMKTVIEANDVVVGGKWRYVQSDPDGSEYAFSGEYREVDEPRKLVRTFEYEPIPGHVLLETLTFEARDDGGTLLSTTAHYENLADLEGMVAMGMEGGQRESFERLAQLVA